MRMLELMLHTQTQADADSSLIKSVLGVKYLYFEFLEAFHREPRDIDDIIDGIIYLEVNAYFNRKAVQKD